MGDPIAVGVGKTQEEATIAVVRAYCIANPHDPSVKEFLRVVDEFEQSLKEVPDEPA